jgi:hypothetical protein
MAMTTARPPARPRQVAHADLDAVLADSFPASDPPSWTPAVFRPAPERRPLANTAGGSVQRLLRRVAALF